LYEQTDTKRQGALRAVISDITARVQGCETFHESLAKHPRVFNRLFISMVKAGEHGGLLAEILDRLAGFLEASARLRKKVKSAMTYPVIVVRSEEHTSELQSPYDLVCRLLLEKKKKYASSSITAASASPSTSSKS